MKTILEQVKTVEAEARDQVVRAETETWEQECHYARHALWYFMMVVYAILHKKPKLIEGDKAQKIQNHLFGLLFVLDMEKSRQRKVVIQLAERLARTKPNDYESWLFFIHDEWKTLNQLADWFAGRGDCFTDADYEKIHAVVLSKRPPEVTWTQKVRSGFERTFPVVAGFTLQRKELLI